MITLFAGLFAGFIHVLAGPDHLAAVAPIAAKYPRRSWASGLRWGLGHSAGVAVVGVLALLLRDVIPVEWISASSEKLVGVLLIGIGAWTLRKAFQIHSHEHEHDDDAHEHIHLHKPGAPHPKAHRHEHAAFGIGTLHGLAGSSHFLGVLPALALPTTTLAVAYLVAFGVGTVVAMMGFSQVIGAVAQRFAINSARAYRTLMVACATAAFVVGGMWLGGFSF